jgi:hypothetical protein
MVKSFIEDRIKEKAEHEAPLLGFTHSEREEMVI